MRQSEAGTRRALREAIAERLVSIGQLDFEDFCLLEPDTLRGMAADPDWPVALANAPHVELAVGSALRLAGADEGRSQFPLPGAVRLEGIQAAQRRLVRRYALELLREKAPPLYDCLPWHDWDFTIVGSRVPVWRTRFLLGGAGTTVTMCRLRRSAGVYVVEPVEIMRAYIAGKAEREKIRRLTVVEATLEQIPLPAGAADLAIVGGTGAVSLRALEEMLRVAGRLLVVDNDPFSDAELPDGNWKQAEVRVRGLGIRPCWWLASASG
ncbi:MAG: hypothetical protein ABIK37_06185 [candidate division WOR-3 bacterium]